MSGFSKGLEKVQVTLKWDPSPFDEPDHDLDIVAATYTVGTPHGSPDYLVHFDSRSPDGTITLDRDSRTGQGFGADEAMTLELERLAETYTRVVVGVAIQQADARRTFGEVSGTVVKVVDGLTELAEHDFGTVAGSTAAVVAEFVRGDAGDWEFRPTFRGFDVEPAEFTDVMGRDHH